MSDMARKPPIDINEVRHRHANPVRTPYRGGIAHQARLTGPRSFKYAVGIVETVVNEVVGMSPCGTAS